MVDTVPVISYKGDDGNTVIVTPMTDSVRETLEAAGFDTSKTKRESEHFDAARWPEGQLIFPGHAAVHDAKYRSPKLSIPEDYPTRAAWSNEYYESEPLVYSLVNRDIDQAITDEEFQLPEEQEDVKKVLQRWRGVLNKPLGLHGGLSEFNRSLALELILNGLTITYPNWGPLTVKSNGKNVTYQMPLNLVNLDARSIITDIDSFTGQRHYYYKLSRQQVEDIKNYRTNHARVPGILQIIPDAKKLIVDDLKFIFDKPHVQDILGHSATSFVSNEGAWLDLPLEDAYVINYRARQQELYPTPSLVPIFSAIAMKRKLQLADWAVADGMVNMIVVWTFPPNVEPQEGKALVTKFVTGGRVQSHGIPNGAKVEIVTPDATILNSSEKFWQPVSEILAHFGYPLNSKSRGAGDLDSGSLDTNTNKARLSIIRETVEDHNNFFFRQIQEKNEWDFDVYGIIQSRDLDDDDNFRTFASSLFDRGLLSIETMLDLANTSMEREKARREKEDKEGLDKVFEIRPSFAQGTVGTAQDGRPPKSQATGTGNDTQKQQSRSSRGRAPTSAKVTQS